MKTFCIDTLGCKVNQYETEQLAAALRARGLVSAPRERADLRVLNTCSVTLQAASKSRQIVRQSVRLPLLRGPASSGACDASDESPGSLIKAASTHPTDAGAGTKLPKVVVTGCWATSDRSAALAIPGVDAVLTHHDDVAAELDRLLTQWQGETTPPDGCRAQRHNADREPPPKPVGDEGWMTRVGTPAGNLTAEIRATSGNFVNEKPAAAPSTDTVKRSTVGTTSLPLLGEHQTGRQRAFLKVQDGCDAHCTYCIIPSLRPTLWSKAVDDAVAEARRLVEAGHVEIVLTGIFLGAYGQPTALRRRQPEGTAPIGELVNALCTRVPGMRRLRLSSLEPGDLTDDLIAALRCHPQVVPHFHLPLQSGSDLLLRRMNRQYTRGDFLDMVQRVRAAFDRPALTTDVMVGFPGESDDEFLATMQVVDRAAFIHIHAFAYSPRPGTAGARWKDHFVRGRVLRERMQLLSQRAAEHSLEFRSQFVGEVVELLVEQDARGGPSAGVPGTMRQGRCERYFAVELEGGAFSAGDFVRARITRVEGEKTFAVSLDDSAGPR